MQSLLQSLFTNQQSRAFRVTNNVLAVVTIVSIVSLVLETVPSLQSQMPLFVAIEWIAVVIFTGEYVGRLLISKPRWRYSMSFFGVVDLVSILPTFLGLGNLTFLKSARALRIIRLLRMVRLAKVARAGVVSDERFGVLPLNILIYFTTLVTALLISGTAMYLVEPNLSAFASIPAGMWWSFKVFMGSIAVPQPETVAGEVLYVFSRFTGLLLLGLLVGVVGNVYRAVMLGKRD